MRNPICEHCKFKRAFCWAFRCDTYYEAQYKRTERRFYKNFMEDYPAEDRFTLSLFIGFSFVIVVLIFMIMCVIKVIGDWMI